MKKKILSLVMVCVMLMSCFSFVAMAASTNDAPAPAEEEDYEAPQMMVTEGELQTLKSVDALNVGDVYVPEDTDAPMMVLSKEDGSIMPYASGKLHIPVTDYTSSTDDYNESFSCSSGDGNRLNIWVKNNGEDTVVLNVDWSKFFGIVNEQYDAVEIVGGDQYTMTFYYEDGRGIDGNWDVNVTKLSGGSLDITVSARQYQYNRSVESSPTGNPDDITNVIFNTVPEAESSAAVAADVEEETVMTASPTNGEGRIDNVIVIDPEVMPLGNYTDIEVPANTAVFFASEYLTQITMSVEYMPSNLDLYYGIGTKSDGTGNHWANKATGGSGSVVIAPGITKSYYPYLANGNSKVMYVDFSYYAIASIGTDANDSVGGYKEIEMESDEVFVGEPDVMVASATDNSQKYGTAKNSEVDFSNYESVDATVFEVSDGLYQVIDETGEVIALYEAETSTGVQPRLGWTIDWTVKPNVQTAADSQFSSYNGLKFSYELDFSRTGSSKIGYANHNKQTITWVETSDDGFDGSFTFLKDVGMVSLAIKNVSDSTITYSGVYYVS